MPRRLRILYIGYGDTPMLLGRIAPFVDEAEVCLVTPHPVPPAFAQAHPGLRIELYPRPLLRKLPRRLYLHTVDFLGETWALIRRFRPDVIHVHYVSQLATLALLPVRRTPIVLSVVGADVLEDQVPRPLWIDLLVSRLFQRAAAVTAKTQFLATECERMGTPSRRIHLVPWGVDTAQFAPADAGEGRRALGLPSEGRILLSSRALQPLYNHEPLIEAVAALETPPTVVFSLSNHDPGYRARVEALARSLDVPTRFLDALTPERMPALYAAADACASIPSSDGLPQTVLEALACQRPTVALDLEAYRELPFAPDALLRVAHVGGHPDRAALTAALDAALADTERPGLAAARSWIQERAELSESVAQVRALYRSLAR